MSTFTDYAGGSLDGLKQNEFVQLYKSWLETHVFNGDFWEQYGDQFADFFAGDDWGSYFDIYINQNGDLEGEGIAYPYLVLKDLELLVDDADLEAFTELLSALNDELGEMFGDGANLEVKTGRTTQERTYFDSFELKEEADPVYYEIGFEDGAILGENGEDGIDGEDGSDAYNTGPGNSGDYFFATDGVDGDAGGDGSDALIIEDPQNYDAIRITSMGDGPNQILGGSGGDGGDGGEGGDGTTGSGNTYADGADGGDGGAGGQSGHAIVNGNDDAEINTIVIEGDQDLTILGGTGGSGGAGGVAGAGTGSGSDGQPGEDGVDGVTSAAFSHRVDVDATGLDAHLTISGSDFDDTFVLGDKGNDLHATRGADSYTLGDDVDIIRYTSLARNEDGSFDMDTLIGFDVNEDQIDISALVGDAWSYDFEDGQLAIDLDNDGTFDLTIELVGVDSISDDIFIA
ncbi:hypothetical protein [Halomonas alkalicola]|uniref:hypothetical protein n=1 Tax=Halomonas alkalicola TaxID=1930622 RepID=UPI00265FA49F|nr:hypothetical protein [Halomonas alkalicola]